MVFFPRAARGNEMISKNSENMTDNSESKEKLPDDVTIAAQEINIVKGLASNDLSQRTKQLSKLRRWLTIRAESSFPFKEEDFLRIWKGLYYMMWMSDKPLVQEELAEKLGKLTECFSVVDVAVLFFAAFLKTMCREWFGIDQWRMNKFLMLVRRMVRYTLRVLKDNSWSPKAVKLFNQHIVESVLEKSTSDGITMHFIDVIFEELAKVSKGNITAKTVGQFAKPFVGFMAQKRDMNILIHCRTRVFYHLLYQSELGREYNEKFQAWEEMGFPTKSIDDLEKVESGAVEQNGEDDETTDNKGEENLDPRAGNVDVYMPLLPVEGKYIIKEIENVMYKEETSTRNRKILRNVLEKFKIYDSGKFPLGVKKMPRPNFKTQKPLVSTQIEELDKLEDELYGTSRMLKQLNKKKRKKVLASVALKDTDQESFDKVIRQKISNQLTRKKRPVMTWIEEKRSDNEEGVSPKKKAKKAWTEEKLPADENNVSPNKKAKVDKEAKTMRPQKNTNKMPIKTTVNSIASEWNKPLQEGEVEYFVRPMKIRLKQENAKMFKNPVALKNSLVTKTSANLRGKQTKLKSKKTVLNPLAPGVCTPTKSVRIVLNKNTIHKPSDDYLQMKSSPSAEAKPAKSILKPTSVPSPINPFYIKKFGIKLNKS